MQNMRMGMIAKEEEEAPHHHDFEVTIMIMHIHKKDIKWYPYSSAMYPHVIRNAKQMFIR